MNCEIETMTAQTSATRSTNHKPLLSSFVKRGAPAAAALLLAAGCGLPLAAELALGEDARDEARATLAATPSPSGGQADAGPMIRLVDAFFSECPPVSGCYSSDRLRINIEVQNVGYEKKVELVYTIDGATWQTLPATYLRPSSPGKELWVIRAAPTAHEFALSYSVNGRTFWDNNSGANYRFQRYSTDALLPSAPIGVPVGLYEADLQSPRVWGHVFVSGAVPNAQVRVVYTDDAWKTTKETAATSYGVYASGAAAWAFELPLARGTNSADVQIAFALDRLDSAGPKRTDWDNNFGLNYRILDGAISR